MVRSPCTGAAYYNKYYEAQSGILAHGSAYRISSRLRSPCQALPDAEIAESLAKLRIALLEEEVGEYIDAVSEADLTGIADALADIVYVAYGTAITYGIDLDRVLSEVHRSNMSKLDASGKPLIRSDGKVIKSDQYFPPDVAGTLKLQPPLPV